jgi:hypothetical protein
VRTVRLANERNAQAFSEFADKNMKPVRANSESKARGKAERTRKHCCAVGETMRQRNKSMSDEVANSLF